MKLLIITQALDQKNPVLGFFVRWVLEFSRQCESVVVICLEKGLYDLPDNVTVHSLGKESRRSRILYLARLYTFLMRERNTYDAVFVHMNPEYVLLSFLWWWIGGKKIGLWYLHKHVGIRLRLAEMFTDVIFTATPESFRLESKKVRVLGHGIDTDFFPHLTREEHVVPQIISVGRMTPIKKHDLVVEAVRVLRDRGYVLSLTIVGAPAVPSDCAYEERLKKRVAEYGLEKEVYFTGPVPHADLPAYLFGADFFVHPGDTGSLDKTALEAMASGLPLISSNDSTIPLLQHFPELVFEKDSVASLVSSMEYVLSLSHKERVSIGRVLREVVEKHHTLPGLVTSILKTYDELR